jgi:hypothetical protein
MTVAPLLGVVAGSAAAAMDGLYNLLISVRGRDQAHEIDEALITAVRALPFRAPATPRTCLVNPFVHSARSLLCTVNECLRRSLPCTLSRSRV